MRLLGCREVVYGQRKVAWSSVVVEDALRLKGWVENKEWRRKSARGQLPSRATDCTTDPSQHGLLKVAKPHQSRALSKASWHERATSTAQGQAGDLLLLDGSVRCFRWPGWVHSDIGSCCASSLSEEGVLIH